MEIGFAPAFRIKFDRAAPNRLDRRAGQFLHVAEPLEAHQRFDRHVAALGITDAVTNVFDLLDQSLFGEHLDAQFARGETIQPFERRPAAAVERGVRIHDVDDFKLVTFADFEVVGVVRRRDLHAAGSLGRVGVKVGDDRNFPVGQRQLHHFADQMAITFILRMDGHGGVAEHRLRTGGRHHQITRAVGQWITEMIEFARHILVDHLFVGKRALRHRTPVDHPLPAVDVTFVVQFDENLPDRLRQPLVHREAFPLPVAGAAERAQLTDDLAAEFAAPLPDAADELFAAEFVAACVLLLAQIFLDPRLGGDSGVVGAGEPAHLLAEHPVVAAENILKRIVQHMPERQNSGDVRRRNHNRICFLSRGGFPVKIPGLFPDREPFGLDLGGFVGSRKRFACAHKQSCSCNLTQKTKFRII